MSLVGTGIEIQLRAFFLDIPQRHDEELSGSFGRCQVRQSVLPQKFSCLTIRHLAVAAHDLPSMLFHFGRDSTSPLARAQAPTSIPGAFHSNCLAPAPPTANLD